MYIPIIDQKSIVYADKAHGLKLLLQLLKGAAHGKGLGRASSDNARGIKKHWYRELKNQPPLEERGKSRGGQDEASYPTTRYSRKFSDLK